MDASTTVTSLLSAPVLAFVLGVVAVAVRSDLKVPEAVTQTLSIYLLLAIGIKGGVALADTDPASLAVPLLLALAFGLLTPVLAYFALRVLTRLGPVDRGSIAAHYGSTSLVTFTAALVALESAAIAVPGYAATVLTVLEIPGILVGLLLARRHTARHSGWGATIHEILTGKSILLLAGGLVIGAIIGDAGYAPIEPFFGEPFRGALVLFLLALGIEAANKFAALRTSTAGLIAFAVGFPLIVGSAAVLAGASAGLGVGGAAILGVLCASASYIAAPAAVRMSLPDANLAYPLAASLGVTFPVNLTIGIPLFTWLALALA